MLYFLNCVLGIFECVDLAVKHLYNANAWQVAYIIRAFVRRQLKLIILDRNFDIGPVSFELRGRISRRAKFFKLEEVLVDHEMDPLSIFAEACQLSLVELYSAPIKQRVFECKDWVVVV
jgi:hypothetical protein